MKRQSEWNKWKNMLENSEWRVLGLEQIDEPEVYACTPKDAEIFACAGVDGIHYCTIPLFGEMIFTVNPMDFGDYVHPIARKFEDLFRLILGGADMAALE